MKRKVYEQLLEWKSQEHHKPLILNGVRQCGKTYVLKEFGRQEFDSLAYVSCDRNVNLQAIYSGDFDVARIIKGLGAVLAKAEDRLTLAIKRMFLFFYATSPYFYVLFHF